MATLTLGTSKQRSRNVFLTAIPHRIRLIRILKERRPKLIRASRPVSQDSNNREGFSTEAKKDVGRHEVSHIAPSGYDDVRRLTNSVVTQQHVGSVALPLGERRTNIL